jgi:hypothetical protein
MWEDDDAMHLTNATLVGALEVTGENDAAWSTLARVSACS